MTTPPHVSLDSLIEAGAVNPRYEVWRHGEVRDRTEDLTDASRLVAIYVETDAAEGHDTTDTYIYDTDEHCEVNPTQLNMEG